MKFGRKLPLFTQFQFCTVEDSGWF